MTGRSGSAPAAGGLLLVAVGLGVLAVAMARGVSALPLGWAAGLLAALALATLVVIRNDFGIYVVIFSMLLSPEFTLGGALAESRAVVLRSEDFVLLVIGLSWLAKTAVNKELGLVAKTPLNRPILAYVLANVVATLVGYLLGTVQTAAGLFYVVKYAEYFVVYYMVVNNVRDRPHAWRMVTAAFITAAIVSLVGAAQVPSGHRVSAPFEGEIGEPNTFGGYLLLMLALAAGVALESRRLRQRARLLGLLGLMTVPFLFTLSRASYLGAVPAVLTLAALSTRRRLVLGLLALAVVASPLVIAALPPAVTSRVLYTFQPERGQQTVRVGGVAFDPSTSARLLSFGQALEGWRERPLLGWGVTGFKFMDAQYARVLAETGVIGLVTFLWLVWSVLRAGLAARRTLLVPEDRGLAVGFVAGTVGLLVHAIGSNTFVIVRIMEPFWLFAGIVTMLPTLQAAPTSPARDTVRS